jgi:hypothetical protein
MRFRPSRRHLIAWGFCILSGPLFAQEAKPPEADHKDSGGTNGDNPTRSLAQTPAPSPRTVSDNDKARPAPQERAADNPKEQRFDHLWADLKITDVLVTVFTGALAIYTYRLWRSTEKLWASGENQLQHATRVLDAAQEANKISRDTMTADHRPWIAIDDPRADDDIQFIDNRAVITFSVRVTNVGKRPRIS